MIAPAKKLGLTPAEKVFYEENGYLLAKAVFTREEAEHFRSETHHIAQRLQAAQIEGVSNEGWGAGAKVTDLPRELLHCHNVQYQSASMTRLISDPRLTDRAADIIGPNIQLHHTKMFIKPYSPKFNIPTSSILDRNNIIALS